MSYLLGLDRSGNNNNFTVNNMTLADQMLDTPTNNFCTWNPISNGGIATLSEGNLSYNPNGTATTDYPNGINGTVAVSSGKWYFETCRKVAGNDYHTGIAGYVSGVLKSFQVYSGTYFYGAEGDANISFGAGSSGDIIGCAFDLDSNKIWFAKNNTWYESSNPSNGTAGTSNLTLTANLENVSLFTYAPNASYTGTDIQNCGQDSSFAGEKTAQGNQDGNGIGDFYYEPPTGFLALCTKNLPDVDVVPSEHFNTVLYTGNATAQRQITGVGFQSDWTWIKGRSGTFGAYSHFLFDAVRGVGKQMHSDTTGAEATNLNNLYSFDSDGFSLGQSAQDSVTNGISTEFIAWNWKANGSGSSNTNGSINTTATSANVDAGFSVSTWTGNATSGASVGHGLSKAPEMIINKCRSSAGNWAVYHAGNTSAPETEYLELETNAATADIENIWNDQAPTSSVFYLGNNASVNGNGETFVTYCFHSVDGYSKVGSYTGNSSADGPFVYTGFRPKWILMKNTSRAGSWYLVDTKQDSGFNSMNTTYSKHLLADTSGAQDSPSGVDFLSNGFKLRTPGTGQNYNTDTIIYIAFAKTPFKYSNAR